MDWRSSLWRFLSSFGKKKYATMPVVEILEKKALIKAGNFPAFCLRRLHTLSRYPGILRRKLDADTFPPGGERGQSRGPAAEEGLKDSAAFRGDAHELRHQRERLACEMDFFGTVYRIPEDTRQALSAMTLQTPLASVDDTLGVPPGIHRALAVPKACSRRRAHAMRNPPPAPHRSPSEAVASP